MKRLVSAKMYASVCMCARMHACVCLFFLGVFHFGRSCVRDPHFFLGIFMWIRLSNLELVSLSTGKHKGHFNLGVGVKCCVIEIKHFSSGFISSASCSAGIASWQSLLFCCLVGTECLNFTEPSTVLFVCVCNLSCWSTTVTKIILQVPALSPMKQQTWEEEADLLTTTHWFLSKKIWSKPLQCSTVEWMPKTVLRWEKIIWWSMLSNTAEKPSKSRTEILAFSV